jgi:hypothetical protein
VIRRLVAAALVLAACSRGPRTIGARFAAPAAVVAFAGVTAESDGVRPYLAVASSRGDELRFVDADDLQPVVGPGVVFPLSVPTARRPLLLAAASFGDGRPDALVVASADAPAGVAGPAVQLVETWAPTNRIAATIPLSAASSPAIPGGAEVLAMAGLPPRGDGRARVFLALSGGWVAQLVFARTGDATGAVALAAAGARDVGFDAADLAADPGGGRLFAASRDPIATGPGAAVQGVAALQLAGPGGVASDEPTSWTVTALPAGGPTVAVAAGRVPERTIGPGSGSADRFDFAGAPLSVYAALAPAGCGRDAAVSCGVVTLRPDAGGLAPDPAAAVPSAGVPPQPFRAPIPVPGVPVRLALAFPPAAEGSSERIVDDAANPGSPLLRILAQGGFRNAPAVAAVTSTDGAVYLLDVARFAPVTDISAVSGATHTRVISASSGTTAVQLGLWNDLAVQEGALAALDAAGSPPAPDVVVDQAALLGAVEVWPGFTPTDDWTVAWQGFLPGLVQRTGVLVVTPGPSYVAVQSLVGTSGAAPVATARIGDPALGVRPGDLVTVDPFVSDACEAVVAAVLAPGAPELAAVFAPGFPGGALRLEQQACLRPSVGGSPATSGEFAAVVTVRAAGLVLTGARFGYAGRPELDVPYALAARDPAGLPPEAALLAAKARRLFYPSDGGCPRAPVEGSTTPRRDALPSGCYPGFPNLADPLQPGPVLRFRVGARGPADAAGALVPSAGAAVSFRTEAALAQAVRRPATAGVLPSSITALDRSGLAAHRNDPVRFAVTYLDDQLVVFSPTEGTGTVTSVR